MPIILILILLLSVIIIILNKCTIEQWDSVQVVVMGHYSNGEDGRREGYACNTVLIQDGEEHLYLTPRFFFYYQ